MCCSGTRLCGAKTACGPSGGISLFWDPGSPRGSELLLNIAGKTPIFSPTARKGPSWGQIITETVCGLLRVDNDLMAHNRQRHLFYVLVDLFDYFILIGVYAALTVNWLAAAKFPILCKQD